MSDKNNGNQSLLLFPIVAIDVNASCKRSIFNLEIPEDAGNAFDN
jgi:hypothetical protein